MQPTSNPTPPLMPPAGTSIRQAKKDHSTRKASRSFARKALNTFPLYVLLAPTIIGMLLFSYWPKLDTFRFAFYEWIPGSIADFTGWKNFENAWHDDVFRYSFALVGLLLVANLFKMIPSMLGAILLHRLKSDRLRYIFQICFVIPMIIPGLVWLLLWKGFMDPNVGLVNSFLNATGLMDLLVWMDHRMFLIADFLYPLTWVLDLVLTDTATIFERSLPGPEAARLGNLGVWALLAAGFVLMMCAGGRRKFLDRWMLAIPVVGTAVLLMQFKAIIVLPVVFALAWVLRNQAPDYRIGDSRIYKASWGIILVSCLLLLLTRTWNERIGAFDTGQPAWLGHSDLVVPALIFWGFPWIQAVGVLIYLAGLQQISNDVYEAADLDGMSSLRKVFSIELPLILTQVRINLIFMTIGTLNSYGFFLILLGSAGGPGGKGMVPGLYMYQQAFVANRFGYACALGLVVFLAILLLTIVYQRHVKVDK